MRSLFFVVGPNRIEYYEVSQKHFHYYTSDVVSMEVFAVQFYESIITVECLGLHHSQLIMEDLT